MSMFRDIAWAIQSNTHSSPHNANELAAFAATFQPGLWCFPGPATESTWWRGNPWAPAPKGKCDMVEWEMVDIFRFQSSHPIFLGTSPPSHVKLRLKKGNMNEHSQAICENKKVVIQTILACQLMCSHNVICHWFAKHNVIRTPRKPGDVQPAPALTSQKIMNFTQRQSDLSQARGDSKQDPATLIKVASEEAKHSRIVRFGQLFRTTDPVWDAPCCRGHSLPRNIGKFLITRSDCRPYENQTCDGYKKSQYHHDTENARLIG